MPRLLNVVSKTDFVSSSLCTNASNPMNLSSRMSDRRIPVPILASEPLCASRSELGFEQEALRRLEASQHQETLQAESLIAIGNYRSRDAERRQQDLVAAELTASLVQLAATGSEAHRKGCAKPNEDPAVDEVDADLESQQTSEMSTRSRTSRQSSIPRVGLIKG